MITLEEYKDYLIYYFKHEVDNSHEKRKKRREELSHKYSDGVLSKIIEDTYDFIKEILDSDIYEENYYCINLKKDNTSSLILDICGEEAQDKIYYDINGRMISKYILGYVFEHNIYIRVGKEQNELYTSLDDKYSYYLCVENFPGNLKEIKEEIFGKTKLLQPNN